MKMPNFCSVYPLSSYSWRVDSRRTTSNTANAPIFQFQLQVKSVELKYVGKGVGLGDGSGKWEVDVLRER